MTSVRGSFFAPQMALNSALRIFGAKMPFPAFFMAAAIFLPFAFDAILPAFFFSAVIFFNAASQKEKFVGFNVAVLGSTVLLHSELHGQLLAKSGAAACT